MRGKGTLTAHQLARRLLAGPDHEVMLIVDSAAADWCAAVELDPGANTVDLHGRTSRPYDGWEHCSPQLLADRVDCASTTRRACECTPRGSHDHLVSR